ncbi:hypothetical protein BASA81_013138 [Batrachochytrium salamandrivorans]|nr:hypothetical protein BASA81_013138 [Batrachochytrium salamandrivorans]
MDLPFSLRELDHALGSMHPRKAPGDDGITTALMQAIAHDPKDHATGDVNLDRPGLSQEHHPRGLMFADDIAIIAPLTKAYVPLWYEYLGVIIDDLLTLSPWLAKKKRAITAAAHSISPLLRNNALSTRYRLTIFNGLVLGVAYYGLELIGGNSTLARRLQAPVNTGIRMILKAPLFTPIAPMLTDCGIISLDAHAILARVRLTVKATTLKTPLRTLLLPSYSISL